MAVNERWLWMITKEHELKPDALVWCRVGPPARCLVNRRQTPTPEAEAAAETGSCSGLRGGSRVFTRLFFEFGCFFLAVSLYVVMMSSLYLRATCSTQSIMGRLDLCCWFLCKRGIRAVTCWSSFEPTLLALWTEELQSQMIASVSCLFLCVCVV